MTETKQFFQVVTDFWGKIIREKRIQKHYSVIPDNQIINDRRTKTAINTGDECYFRIVLNNLYLKDRRILWNQVIPMVHSLLTFKVVGKSESTVIPQIIGSKQIEKFNDQLDDVIDLNKVVIGPVVYSGSEIEILLALFAVKSKDYAEVFLNVLSSLSDMVGGGSEINTALKIIEPLKEGLGSLIGIGEIEPKIGLHDTIGVKNGNFYGVVIDRAQDAQLASQLWVDGGRLYHKDPQSGELKIYQENDYFLFSFEWLKEREDWQTLESVYSTYHEALKKTGSNDQVSSVDKFKNAVFDSMDLTLPNKIQIIKYLQDAQKTMLHCEDRSTVSEIVTRSKSTSFKSPGPVRDSFNQQDLIKEFIIPFSDNKLNVKKVPIEEAEKWATLYSQGKMSF